MFCIEIAGLPIGIHHRFAFLPAQCGAYLTCQPPRFTVCASDEALFREAAADRRYPPLSPPNRFAPERPWGYYESLCVCRAICRRLPFYDAFLIHAAALAGSGQDLLACDRQMCGFWKGGYEEKILAALRRAEQAYGTPPPQG